MRSHGVTTGTTADGFRRLEVITGVGRRRRWSDEGGGQTTLAIIHRWALDGHGIMLRSFWDVAEGLFSTRLSRSPKVRVLIRLLTDRLVREGRAQDDS
jgi:hypothetical protein